MADNQDAALVSKKNRMTPEPQFEPYSKALEALLENLELASEHFGSGRQDSADVAFEEKARGLFLLQFAHVPAYQAFCRAQGKTPETVSRWSDIPAVPASAFKEFDLSSLPPTDRVTVFRSSGTTGQTRSEHAHSRESLRLYEASLWPWFEKHLLDGMGGFQVPQVELLALTPPPEQAARSSLVYMFEFIRRRVGALRSDFCGVTQAASDWTVHVPTALKWLQMTAERTQPALLLGTAFSFVHLLDALEEHRIKIPLPPGSRVLETGGYKGRSRTLAKPDLYRCIGDRLGIPPEFIVCEYGMSELSSQAYDHVAGHTLGKPRVFRFPPWARFEITDPETGGIAPEGRPGLLRIFDLANVRSVMALQTEDLAVRRGDGFELLGRSTEAEPRGCSLMSGDLQRPVARDQDTP